MNVQDLNWILSLRQSYGDIVYLKLGPLNGYVLFSPEYVQHVLVKNQKNYIKGMGYDGLRLMLGQGLVTSDGEIWQQDRRLMSPHFTPAAITRHAEMMTGVIRAMLDRWQTSVEAGKAVHIDEEMIRLTMSIIGKAMFSIDLGEEMNEVGRALREAFTFIPSRFGSGGLLPITFPLPSHRRFQHNMQIIDAFLKARIAEGRERGGENMLSVLLRAQDAETGYQLSDKRLRDEVATLFFAGFETTARSLSWGWYLLGRHPQAFARLAEEARQTIVEGETPDLARLKYSRQVVDETLRIYPPTALLARQNVEEDQIGGYTIPPGSMIILVPYFVHRYPGVWDDAERFDPDRFGEQAPARPKPAYIPFASGPRVCLGNSFALMEMTLTFSLTAARYNLTPIDAGEIKPQFAGTTRPDRALWMKVENKS